MSRILWHLGLASFLAFTACKVDTGEKSSDTLGLVNVVTDIKPFAKMRSASELHTIRLGLIKSELIHTSMSGTKKSASALRNIVMRQILAAQGIPRVQLKAVLENLLASKSASCAGVTCARIFGVSSGEVDTFLDEALELVKKMKPKAGMEKTKELLVSSLMRNSEGPQSGWVITLAPDPDSKLWREKTQYSTALYPDFPSRAGEKDSFAVTSEFSASVHWGPTHEEQLKSWKKEFDSVDDCATRGTKRGKTYASFNDCLAEANLEERQFLSAKLVFAEIEDDLAKTNAKYNPRRNYRAVFDKNGNMQGLIVVHKTPSVSYYASHYKGAIPDGATQIPALEVAYLLAAPWNLRSEHPKKVKGAGSACLGLAALESKRGPWAGRLILEGSPSAVPYYQKLGFTAIGETFDEHYGLLPAMWLEPKYSEKLIPAHLK